MSSAAPPPVRFSFFFSFSAAAALGGSAGELGSAPAPAVVDNFAAASSIFFISLPMSSLCSISVESVASA